MRPHDLARAVVAEGERIQAAIERFNALEVDLLDALAANRDNLTDLELWGIYEAVRVVRQPGWSVRWKAALGDGVEALRSRVKWAARYEPNDGVGWAGPAAIGPHDPSPRKGTFVVYYLFDRDGRHVYTGSTGDLRTRIKAHRWSGKDFLTWQTSAPYPTREAAYEAEARELLAYLPILNQRLESDRRGATA